MAQKKLLRFAQLKTFSNVKEYPTEMAGNWQHFFKNDAPITLELACGRGEYTVGLASMYAQQNFLGVDVKGNRMYIGARQAQEKGLQNAGFLRTQIEMLGDYFAPAEVSEIWITFPDPQLRTSTAKRRLTKRVIELYGLFLVEESEDVYAGTHKPELDIKTHYEGLDIAQSKKIHYLRFSLASDIPDLDEQLQQELKETENKTLR